MDHSNHVRLRDDELTQDVLVGAAVYGPDDTKVGTVDHVHGFGVDVKASWMSAGCWLGSEASCVVTGRSRLHARRKGRCSCHH